MAFSPLWTWAPVLDNETAVTLQSSDGVDTYFIEGEPTRIKPELGSDFGPSLFPMDYPLLEALALDANEFQEWIDHYPIFSFKMARADRPDEQISGVGSRRGLESTKNLN